MNINELKINNKNINVSELYLNEINNILVTNYKTLYTFLNSFFDNQDSSIYLGNHKIDQKNSYIINLLDYESISNQLVLKKGTILYDYLIDEIIEKVEDSIVKEELEFELKRLIDIAIEEKTLDYNIDFSIDLVKIINNYMKIDIDLTIDNYIKIIKILIYNLKNKNLKKSIIIFVNNNIFKNTLDDLNNVTIFKFYSNDFPNILIDNEVINIDKNILINQIKLNWPCEILNEECHKIVEKFKNIISINNEISTTNYYEYIGYKIIIKVLNTNLICKLEIVDEDAIPLLYKNFIKTLL